jgi:hypothetical protein
MDERVTFVAFGATVVFCNSYCTGAQLGGQHPAHLHEDGLGFFLLLSLLFLLVHPCFFSFRFSKLWNVCMSNVVDAWEVHTTNKKNTASPKIQEYELGSASTITW